MKMTLLVGLDAVNMYSWATVRKKHLAVRDWHLGATILELLGHC